MLEVQHIETRNYRNESSEIISDSPMHLLNCATERKENECDFHL